MKEKTKNNNSKQNKKKKAFLFGLVGLVVLVLLALGGMWIWFHNAPKPLGDRLEYIGKQDYGCWLVCDSPPSSNYFYTTNMTLDEITRSLSQTSRLHVSEIMGGSNEYTFQNITLYLPHQVIITYYVDGEKAASYFGLKRGHKQHLIEIDSSDYEALRRMLN